MTTRPQFIRNIWAIGRNYSDHALELGNDVPTTPMVFLKAGSCLQADETELVFPDWLENIHYELEVAFQLNERLEVGDAFLALDFTERNIQSELKKNSHPWTLAKSFPGACAISSPIRYSDLGDLDDMEISLSINGKVRQQGNTRDMIFDRNTLLTYIKARFPVCPGDLILTGTPSGVGPIHSGDELFARCSLGTEHQWSVHQPVLRGKT